MTMSRLFLLVFLHPLHDPSVGGYPGGCQFGKLFFDILDQSRNALCPGHLHFMGSVAQNPAGLDTDFKQIPENLVVHGGP